MELKINKKVDFKTEEIANHLKKVFDSKGILVLNMISSPGSGKTSLLEKTLSRFKNDYRLAVVEGDPATNRDARRLEKMHVPVSLINTSGTGSSCHLTAGQVLDAIEGLPLDDLDIIFIENVGNLVCPAAYELGEHSKILLFSVPEGDDKPAKYPLAFRVSDCVLINKLDLLPYCDFSVKDFKEDAMKVNPRLEILSFSIKSGDGLSVWFDWIEKKLKEVRA
ncbi:MAG: hydrogenase nickel incorporation protein HypB [Caldisericia bacterium]|nr:hydrogenase nickel incorporation protein HypB [Caldisericia bacterium]